MYVEVIMLSALHPQFDERTTSDLRVYVGAISGGKGLRGSRYSGLTSIDGIYEIL